MANRNFPNGTKIYIPHVKPVLLDCNFIVDATNGNGLGIRSLKGPYIQNVFMHTSATPGTNNGQTNPNPAVGYIQVRLQDNYTRYLSGFSGQISVLSGTPLTATTAGQTVVIVSLGTATLAQWQAVGFPAGFTPAVGASFVPTSSATIGGSATVETITANGSGISHIEIVGDPNTTLANSAQPTNGGGILNMAIFGAAGSGVVTPANGSVISLAMYFNDSSVPVNGSTS